MKQIAPAAAQSWPDPRLLFTIDNETSNGRFRMAASSEERPSWRKADLNSTLVQLPLLARRGREQVIGSDPLRPFSTGTIRLI
jgi:hypothetical protein